MPLWERRNKRTAFQGQLLKDLESAKAGKHICITKNTLDCTINAIEDSIMEKVCCFTGHRPQSLPCGFDETHPACLKIRRQLRRLIVGLIEKKDVTHFISSAALGVDMWAMELVLELKDEYPDITLEAAVPCRSQSNRWKRDARIRYRELLSECDEVTILQEQYTSDCMLKRNRYMVDKSDYVLAVWNGQWGSGTGSTVRYALNCEKEAYCVDTVSFKMKNIVQKK